MVSVVLPVILGIVAPGIWRCDALPADTCELIDDRGWKPICVDVAAAADKAELLAAIADAAEFPSHFGHNWDAVADCLTDLAWLDTTGYVFVAKNGGALAVRDPAMTEILLDVLAEASEWWQARGVAFHTIWEGQLPAGLPALEQL
ncbi:MAG: barstar family protein [Acidimicrobiales bacterium]